MSFYSQFSDHYESIFPFRQPTYSFIKNHLKTDQRKILDIACGSGHYCGQFVADGFRGTGIDLDEKMIKTASIKYPEANFHTLNMLDIDHLQQAFDLAFCIGNSAAHLNFDEYNVFLKKLALKLKPGSKFILQLVNWDFMLQQKSWRFPVIEHGDLQFEREYLDISEKGLRFCTSLIQNSQKIFEDEVRLYPIPSTEFIQMHSKENFQLLGHYSDYQKSDFHPQKNSAAIFVFQYK